MATGTADRDNDGPRYSGLFDPRVFLGTLVIVLLASLARGFVPMVGELTSLVATAVVAFAYGASGRRVYAEIGAASAVAAGVTTLTDPIAFLLGFGVFHAVLAAVIGVVVGVVGHYLGRDLRDGFTREL